MTQVIFDVVDLVGEVHPGDKVSVWPPYVASTVDGRVRSTRKIDVLVDEGPVTEDIEPGPMVVQLQCKGIADTKPRTVTIPDAGTVTLANLLQSTFTYTPAVVSQVSLDAQRAVDAAVRAETTVGSAEAVIEARDDTVAAVATLGDAQTVLNARDDTVAAVATLGDAQTVLTARDQATAAASAAASSESTTMQGVTTVQGIVADLPSNVSAELDVRVPPAVASAIAADRAVADAAAAAVAEHAVPVITAETAAIRWDKGHIPVEATSISDLGVGSWSVSNGPRAAIIASPGGRLGTLEIQAIGTSRTATFTSQGYSHDPTGVWVQSERAGVWSGWRKVSSDAATGAGLKSVPLAVTTGGSGDGDLTGRWRVLTQFTAPITRFRVHMSTAHPIHEGDRGTSDLGAVSVGHRSGDSGITGETTLHSGTTTIPAAGEWVSRWVKHDLTRETFIDFSVTAASAYNLLAPAWRHNGSTWTQVGTAPLWVWIEAETYAQTPTVALVGDSTGAGIGSATPVWDAAVHIAARQQKFLPVLYASHGDLLSGNTDPGDRNYARWSQFAPYDSVIIQAGSNDVHNGATLGEMQSRYLGVVDAAAQLSRTVLGGTIKPRYPAHPDYESTRIDYNSWLLSAQPGLTRDVMDFSAAVAPAGVIDPVDDADGAHLTRSGHEKLALAFEGMPLSRPAVVGQTDGPAVVAFTEDPADSGLYIFPTTAGA